MMALSKFDSPANGETERKKKKRKKRRRRKKRKKKETRGKNVGQRNRFRSGNKVIRFGSYRLLLHSFRY